MTSFEKQHAKYQQEQELLHRVQNRRNKLLGQWAADQLRLTLDQREGYIRAVVMSDFEAPGDDDVLNKVHGDFAANGLTLSRQDVRKQMDELMLTARHQIDAEAQPPRPA